MNAAEIKLDMFRKIDSLKECDVEKVYSKFIALLSTTTPYNLSKDEEAAIDEALEAGKDGQSYIREEVMKEARQKYPNLAIYATNIFFLLPTDIQAYSSIPGAVS